MTSKHLIKIAPVVKQTAQQKRIIKAAEKQRKETEAHIKGFLGMCAFLGAAGGIGGIVLGFMTALLTTPEAPSRPKPKP